MITNLIIFAVLLISFVLLFGYYFQHRVIFFPERLNKDFQYDFDDPYDERNFQINEDVIINTLHFKVDESQGVIFYLHGNAGSLRSWGEVAADFTRFQYDVLMIDYRGFGKSRGKISEHALYDDAQYIYNKLKNEYPENKIIVFGRSIGTGIASYIASENNPACLVLESPYLSIPYLAKRYYPWFPQKLIRFKFRNDIHVKKVSCPIYIFHGSEDEIINVESSRKLSTLLKPSDKVFIIPGGHHNDLSFFEEYETHLKSILSPR